MIQCLPSAVGMSPRPQSFVFYKECIIGSKLSIQLLHSELMIFQKKKILSTYIQHYYFYDWMPTNVVSIISRFFWQSYCPCWSAQSYLSLIIPSSVTCRLRMAFSSGTGAGVGWGVWHPSDWCPVGAFLLALTVQPSSDLGRKNFLQPRWTLERPASKFWEVLEEPCGRALLALVYLSEL